MTDSNIINAADEIAQLGYAAFDAGNLKTAAKHFERLTRLAPDDANYQYMRGLACKYLFDWKPSLKCSLRSQELRGEPDEASIWNAGIAATALGDWAEARQQWYKCGMVLPDDAGPVEGNFGIASIRLNAWSKGETVFAGRIDPVRAKLLNVPYPSSGYRFGDVVLHDGASTGRRKLDDGSIVPVFNAFSCVGRSEFLTYTAFLRCKNPDEIAALEMRTPGIGLVEDWTDSVVPICLRCSYGTPHDHEPLPEQNGWGSERHVGIAASSRASVEELLKKWKSKWRGRYVDGIETREFPIELPPENAGLWWQAAEERE